LPLYRNTYSLEGDRWETSAAFLAAEPNKAEQFFIDRAIQKVESVMERIVLFRCSAYFLLLSFLTEGVLTSMLSAPHGQSEAAALYSRTAMIAAMHGYRALMRMTHADWVYFAKFIVAAFAGSRNSHMVTLVERHSGFTTLIKVPSKDTAVVVAAPTRHARKLPAAARRSLTWGRGLEMAKHKTFTMATVVKSISVIRKVHGSAARTKTRIGYYDNTP